MEQEPYKRIQNVRTKATAIPLQYVSIRRTLVIFYLYDGNQGTAPLVALKANQLDQVALGILIDEIVLPLVPSFRHQPKHPAGRPFGAYILQLLEAIRALCDLHDLADARAGNRSHASHQPTEHTSCIDAFIGEEFVVFSMLEEVNGPEVAWPEGQQPTVCPGALAFVSPLLMGGFASFGKIAVAAHIQMAKDAMTEQIKEPERLCRTALRKTCSGVVLDEISASLRRETAFLPPPLKPGGRRLAVTKRHRVLPQRAGVPQRQLDALPHSSPAHRLRRFFITELVRTTKIIVFDRCDSLPGRLIQPTHLIAADSGHMSYLVKLRLHCVGLDLDPLLLLAKIRAVGIVAHESSTVRDRPDEELLHYLQLLRRSSFRGFIERVAYGAPLADKHWSMMFR